jgi:hypothetical protein
VHLAIPCSEGGDNENGELEGFHLNSQSTQKDTKEARKEARKPSRKQAHTLHHAGNSERTIRRRRKTLKDLQAKGFQTLPDFFRNKAEEKKKNAEYDTMVVTVCRTDSDRLILFPISVVVARIP